MNEKEHIRRLHRSLTDMVAYVRHEAAQGDGIHEEFTRRFLRAVELTEGEPYPGHDADLAELKAAIRAFTVDVQDEDNNPVPNGSPHEAKLIDLRDALASWNNDDPQESFDLAYEALDSFAEALTESVTRLRKSADAFFGEDFQAPAP